MKWRFLERNLLIHFAFCAVLGALQSGYQWKTISGAKFCISPHLCSQPTAHTWCFKDCISSRIQVLAPSNWLIFAIPLPAFGLKDQLQTSQSGHGCQNWGCFVIRVAGVPSAFYLAMGKYPWELFYCSWQGRSLYSGRILSPALD